MPRFPLTADGVDTVDDDDDLADGDADDVDTADADAATWNAKVGSNC